MAPSKAYYVWKANNEPYTLMRPAKALKDKLRAHGLTVYDYPNDEHQKANPPQDHTAYSETGWPVASAYGIGHAIDIMPRSDTPAGRAENAKIARKLIADRNANVPGTLWIKYLNWTDEQGICRQERWTPNHTTRSSTDKGHIHISGRSDCDNDTRADNYDPLGATVTIPDAEQRKANLGALNSDNALFHALQGHDPITGNKSVDTNQPVQFPNILATIKGNTDTLVARPEIVPVEMTDEQVETQANIIADRVLEIIAAKLGDVLTSVQLGIRYVPEQIPDDPPTDPTL